MAYHFQYDRHILNISTKGIPFVFFAFWSVSTVCDMILSLKSYVFFTISVFVERKVKFAGVYLNISTATEVSTEAIDIQNDVDIRLLPLTVDIRPRAGLGVT